MAGIAGADGTSLGASVPTCASSAIACCEFAMEREFVRERVSELVRGSARDRNAGSSGCAVRGRAAPTHSKLS